MSNDFWQRGTVQAGSPLLLSKDYNEDRLLSLSRICSGLRGDSGQGSLARESSFIEYRRPH